MRNGQVTANCVRLGFAAAAQVATSIGRAFRLSLVLMPVHDPVQTSQNSAVFIPPRANAQVANYSGRAVFLVLLLAFALRLGWMLYNSQAIENEGAEYARIAQNLLGGHGYK